MPASKTIALFGGSFDPPHVAHVLTVEYVLATQAVDEVWVVPCYKHNFGKESAPYADRIRMCMAAFGGKERVFVSDLEERIGGDSRTVLTIRAIKSVHPDWSVALVVGSDIIPELPNWFRYDELMKEISSLIPIPRGGYHPVGEFTLPSLTSTKVRGLVASGQAIGHLVPRPVNKYIREHKLYLATQFASEGQDDDDR